MYMYTLSCMVYCIHYVSVFVCTFFMWPRARGRAAASSWGPRGGRTGRGTEPMAVVNHIMLDYRIV